MTTTAFPPGPAPRNGNLVGTLRYYANFALDPVGFVRGRFERYGDLYYAPSPDGGLYVVRHPEQLREVLVTEAASYAKTHTAFKQLSRVLGDGLLTTDGDTWKRQRRMVQPAFTPARLAGYALAMTDEAKRTRAAWRSGDAVDVGRTMMELTLRIVSRALFGHDVGGETDAVSVAMNTFQRYGSRPDLMPQWFPSPSRKKLLGALATLDRIVYGMIATRRREGVPAGATDLLSMLVSAVDDEGDGGVLTEKEVRDQLVTLFLAGHETTSQVLTWALYLLGEHPHMQEQLAAELEGALGDRLPTPEDLPRLPFTRQVLEETMRLYPPVYAIARRASADTTLGGFAVAAGSEVMLWPYLTQRDPRWWPEPEVFRPSRFASEDPARPRLAYLPFGAGPRACIGKSFAMLEAQLLLATLASRCRFVAVPGKPIKAVPRITLCPSRPVTMRVYP